MMKKTQINISNDILVPSYAYCIYIDENLINKNGRAHNGEKKN